MTALSNRGQRAVGVLAEILVARRIQPVDGEPSCSKLMTAEETEMPHSRSIAIQSERAPRRAPGLRPSAGSPRQTAAISRASRCEINRKGAPARNLVLRVLINLHQSFRDAGRRQEAILLRQHALDIMAARRLANCCRVVRNRPLSYS